MSKDDDSENDKTPKVPPRAPLFLDREPTDPHTLLSGSLSADQQRLLDLSMREGGDPAPWASVIKLTDSLNRHKHDMVRVVEDLSEAIDPERIERIESTGRATQRAWRSIKKHAWAALIALGGSLGTTIVMLIRLADAHGIDTQRMLQLERDRDDLKQEVRELQKDLREVYSRMYQRSDAGRYLTPPTMAATKVLP